MKMARKEYDKIRLNIYESVRSLNDSGMRHCDRSIAFVCRTTPRSDST